MLHGGQSDVKELLTKQTEIMMFVHLHLLVNHQFELKKCISVQFWEGRKSIVMFARIKRMRRSEF